MNSEERINQETYEQAHLPAPSKKEPHGLLLSSVQPASKDDDNKEQQLAYPGAWDLSVKDPRPLRIPA